MTAAAAAVWPIKLFSIYLDFNSLWLRYCRPFILIHFKCNDRVCMCGKYYYPSFDFKWLSIYCIRPSGIDESPMKSILIFSIRHNVADFYEFLSNYIAIESGSFSKSIIILYKNRCLPSMRLKSKFLCSSIQYFHHNCPI